MEVNRTVCEENTDYGSAVRRVVPDEDQNASTHNMDREQRANVLHGQDKGLFSCWDGMVHFFRQIFSCQDADGDDDKDPLLENPNLQEQVQVESRSIDLGAIQNRSTAESRGGTRSVTAALFKRPRGPKSPGLNPGSGPQHN